MVVFLNGAFGVGKTTVSRLVVGQLRGAFLFDPEPVGVLLQMLRRITRRPVGDFQDLPSWRRATVRGIRLARALRSVVVVPMAFSNPTYLAEIRTAVSRFDAKVLHFCLVAPLPQVLARLERRSFRNRTDLEWQRTRAAECCMAHESELFRDRVPTESLDASRVAAEVIRRVRDSADAGARR